MARARRSVTFWRGAAPTRGDARFLAPRGRWTGTAVEGWPPGVRAQLRAELVRYGGTHPNASLATLAGVAERWMQTRIRPAGVPKLIREVHVEALLRGGNQPARNA